MITVLMENRTCCSELTCEHGLSFHIQTPEAAILFDTGQSGAFAANAGKLGIDLSTTDTVVLSHGHYDHTDGLPALPDLAVEIPVFVHPGAEVERYSIRDIAAPKYIGISGAAKHRLHAMRTCLVEGATSVAPGVTCTGPVPRTHDFEDTGGPFFLDRRKTIEDPITDDQSLIIETSKGLVLLLGCAHAGVVNTIRYCQQLKPQQPIHALIGGFHLVNASASRLDKTLPVIREIRPVILAPCHCTGEGPMALLQATFPESFVDCRTGSRFYFE